MSRKLEEGAAEDGLRGGDSFVARTWDGSVVVFPRIEVVRY